MLKASLYPLVVFTGVALLRAALNTLQNITNSRLRDRSSMLIQLEVRSRAMNVPLARMDQPEYYDRLQKAEIVAGTDLFGVLQNSIGFVRLFFELFGLLIVASLAHPVVAVLLVIIFSISFIIRLESDIVKRRLNRDLTRSGRQSDYLREAVTKPETIRDMRLSGSIDYLINKWSELMQQSLSLRMNANRREIRRGMIVSAVQITGIFAAIMWMVLQMRSGGVMAGTLVIVFQAMRQAYGISFRMPFPIGQIYIQGAKIKDLVEFLTEVPDTRDQFKSADKSKLYTLDDLRKTGRIEFDDVSYNYFGANESTLDSIKLTLNPGEIVALVGENGAGKSTLVKLLLGLYEPTNGRISWDGINFKDIDPLLLRRAMSAVFQDFVRYETTLRDNVGFGVPDKNQPNSTIRQSLQAGGADNIERIMGGLDARIGRVIEGGRDLSGGQWQRLAIARAAIRDAQLLVLDEPTAAIDPMQETELFQSFRKMAKGKTVLFVSHRLGWARHADRIIVLRKGSIIEEGTHEKLLAAKGEYAAMFQTQAEWYLDSV